MDIKQKQLVISALRRAAIAWEGDSVNFTLRAKDARLLANVLELQVTIELENAEGEPS